MDSAVDAVRESAFEPAAFRILLKTCNRAATQLDAIFHIDHTSALEPLERWSHDEVDLPETYPSGM
jgi:hypothetical protein